MLTDKALKAIKPRPDIYEISDRLGLSVRVNPAGRISFQFRYRFNGKATRMKLGTYPEMTLADAREAHHLARAMVDKGIDPAFKKKTERLAAATSETVSDLADEFLTRFIKVHRKRPEHVEQMLDKDIRPRLGAYKVKDVTRRHVIKMLDEIVDRGAPVKANRTASLTKQMFQYALERGIIEVNPCSDIRRQTVGGTEKSRDRNLTTAEIKTFWTKINEAAVQPSDTKKGQYPIGLSMAAALKLLLVTAQRRGELAKAKWLDIDFEKAIWTIPAENSKNAKAHKVPLSMLAIQLFKELRQYAGESDYVLPSPHTKKKGEEPVGKRAARKVVDQKSEKKRNETHITERAITKAAERAQITIGIPKWVPHDLRRTEASHLAELGIPPHVIEKIQNHTMQGVMAVYNRYDYAKECQAALDQWAATIVMLEKNPEGNE